MRFAGDKDNPLHWRFRIGRLARIVIYVHIFFIIGAAILVGEALMPAREGYYQPRLLETFGEIGLLFLIVLIHELGHCFGARATGGEADEVLLWPLGGLAMVHPPHNPRAHFLTTAAGPLVNVILGLAAAAAIALYAGGGAVPLNPLRAMSAGYFAADALTKWLTIFFALNYALLLFNLLPIYPLDGGRMLHALLWPRHGYRNATFIATYVGLVGAAALFIFGILTQSGMVMAIAFFGGLTCYADRKALRMGLTDVEDEFGYDFSKGYAAFDEEPPAKKPGYWERRRAARAEARRIREIEEQRRHQEQVDRILAKVHREGIAALSPNERRVLERETQRQRAAGK